MHDFPVNGDASSPFSAIRRAADTGEPPFKPTAVADRLTGWTVAAA